ncbi:DUF2953 domain-containing protein [Paenibacillus pinistramenti]|uniref:DUF2953 domain-containing protein n=1 Tax=Paenibacillus pinistramenti TaxID=1768003 RepID=UPI0011094939|nr:DUF2953 domain-containing protein [Paenibacillus pinistramenti]
MWIWIWIGLLAAVLILLIAAAMRSKITVSVHVRKQNEDDQIHADMRALFGLVKVHYEVPKIKFDSLKKGFKVQTERETNVPGMSGQTPNEQHIGTEKIHRWSEIYKQLLQSTDGLKQWMDATLKHLNVIKLEWLTDFSMQEADHTAVASGLLWSVKNFVVGGLSFRVRMKNPPSVEVKPSFGASPHFTSQLDCIAQIRLGHAMYAGLTLITRVLKVKGGTKQWLNILFKA